MASCKKVEKDQFGEPDSVQVALYFSFHSVAYSIS